MYQLLLTSIICFVSFFFVYKKWKLSALFTFAIGSIVNSNYLTSSSYPIVLGSLKFGLDSIIYTLFLFCIIIAYLEYDKKTAMSLTYSGVAAVAFSGILQFFADWAVAGSVTDSVFGTLLSFACSIIGTLVAVYIMLIIAEKFIAKKISIAYILTLCIFVGSVINSLLYFGIAYVIGNLYLDNFLNVLLASYIGKIYALLFALATFIFLQRYEVLKPDEKILVEKKDDYSINDNTNGDNDIDEKNDLEEIVDNSESLDDVLDKNVMKEKSSFPQKDKYVEKQTSKSDEYDNNSNDYELNIVIDDDKNNLVIKDNSDF